MKEKVRSDFISTNKSNVTLYMQPKKQILNKFVKKNTILCMQVLACLQALGKYGYTSRNQT